GDIPAIPGVWANAKTLEACREELESVLEGWVLLSIADHSPIPDIDGKRLEIREVAGMPAVSPIKRKDLIACLRALGFEPPVSGGDHQYMKGRGRKLRIPNPHTEDIGRGLLVPILPRWGRGFRLASTLI